MIRPEWNEWTYPAPRTTDWPCLLALLTGLLWCLVLALWFFSGYLWTHLWILALYIDVPIRGLATALTALSILMLVRRRRWTGAFLVAAVCASVLVIVFVDVWTAIYPRIWFWTHREQFVAAEHVIRSGAIGAINGDVDVDLPPALETISVSGTMNSTWAWDEGGASRDPCGANQPILFAPAWIGIPDGATGFVHIPCSVPSGLMLDGKADQMCPAYALADGWWWADGVSCPLNDD